MTRATSILVVLIAMLGCVQKPDEQPATSDLVGTWVPTTHTSRPPTQFLRLNSDHTFVATNFPVSASFGKTANESGTGAWRIEARYAAWKIRLLLGSTEYEIAVRGRKRPFVLTQSIQDDDETLRAQRLEDSKR